jgi:hypothetical protein
MSEITPEQIKEALRNPAGWPTLAHAALAYIEQLEAQVEAALTEAAALFEQDALEMRAEEDALYWTAENDAKRILALITPDAQAALDRVRQAAVAAALREAAGAARLVRDTGDKAHALGIEENAAAYASAGEVIETRILALIPDGGAAQQNTPPAETDGAS